MKKRFKQQKGYAILTALGVSIVALGITSAVLLRLTDSTAQVVRKEKQDQTLVMTESVMNYALDTMAEITSSASYTDVGNATRPGYELTAMDMLNEYHASNADWLRSGHHSATESVTFARPGDETTEFLPPGMSSWQKMPGSLSGVWSSIENNPNHSVHIWNMMQSTNTGSNLSSIDSYSGSEATVDDMLAQVHSVYRMKKDNFQADFKISVVPVGTSIKGTADKDLHTPGDVVDHDELFKMRATAYMPNIKEPTNTRTLEVIFKRKVRVDTTPVVSYDFAHAVLADGSVNLGNQNVTSCTVAGQISGGLCLGTHYSGDVHSNQNITFGPNGFVDGKATSTQTVTLSGGAVGSNDLVTDPLAAGYNATDPRHTTTNVSNKVETKSNVDAYPIPEFDTSGLPTTPCVPQSPSGSTPVVFQNCVINGDLQLSGQSKVIFAGDVHITGNYSQTGQGESSCQDIGRPCRIKVDGDFSSHGNGSTAHNNEIEALFIIDGNMTVRGTVGASGQYGNLYYGTNPNSTASVGGAADFFGAIITKGTVTGNGNASAQGIQRDADMASLQQYLAPQQSTRPKSDYYPDIVSWKEVKTQ